MTQNSSNKRVAICLSGLVRTYRQTFENFKAYLIDCNPGYDIDIFISTWHYEMSNNSMERTRRIAWYGDNSPLFPEVFIDSCDIISKYNPVSFNRDRHILFNQDWYVETPGVNIQSLLCMTYKIMSCAKLCRAYEDTHKFRYDVVVRTRFDSILPFPIVFDSLDLSELLVPSMMQPRIYVDRDWVNDKFAVGNSDDVYNYSMWFNSFAEMVLDGVPVQPETLLSEHLKRLGIKYRTIGSEIELIRPSGY